MTITGISIAIQPVPFFSTLFFICFGVYAVHSITAIDYLKRRRPSMVKKLVSIAPGYRWHAADVGVDKYLNYVWTNGRTDDRRMVNDKRFARFVCIVAAFSLLILLVLQL